MSKRFVSISHFDLVSGTSLLLIKTRKILLDFGILGIFQIFFCLNETNDFISGAFMLLEEKLSNTRDFYGESDLF